MEHSNLHHAARAAGAALIALAVIAAVAAAFALPWLGPAGGANRSSALSHYAPLVDGASSLIVTYRPDGQPLSWRSNNVRILPSEHAVTTDLRPTLRSAIEHFYASATGQDILDDDLPAALAQHGAELYEVRSREIDAAGAITETVSTNLRSPDGDFQFGLYDAIRNSDLIYEPPLHVPADLGQGQAWESHGTLVAGSINFSVHSRVTANGVPLAGSFNRFDDCIKIETSVTSSLSTAGGSPSVFASTSLDWYCAGIGSAESLFYQGPASNNPPATRSELIATSARPGIDPSGLAPPVPMPPSGRAGSAVFATDASRWQLVRVGQTIPSRESGQSTIPPVWIPTHPPLVLVAANRGDLVAFDANDAGGTVAWRYHPGGSVFSPPAYDLQTGHIYFGASDKRLYALDARGLFLWSFNSGDNIATQPLVVSDTVIFGSEDHNVYALDTRNGAVRWQYATHAAVVSSPALYTPDNAGPGKGYVIAGSDDGRVYASDVASGARQWDFAAGAAIEAPIVVTGGVAYVASRDESLYALDATTGRQLWATDIASVLRLAPAVSANRVYVVNTDYRLIALDRATGRVLWRSQPVLSASGRPVLAGDAVVVASSNGEVIAFNPDGAHLTAWATPVTTLTGKDSFTLGASTGGGFVWLADDSATLWRLGPPGTTPQALISAWAVNLLQDAPFSGSLLPIAPAPTTRGDRLALVDRHMGLYLLDPANGQATRLGAIAAPTVTIATDPVVVSDTLLTPMGAALYATSLLDGSPLWSWVPSDGGTILRPAAVSNGLAIVLTQHGTVGHPVTGTLYALNTADGGVRWQTSLDTPGVFSTGNAIIRDGTVYIGTPPMAFDLATGRQLWSLSPGALASGTRPLGGPALSEKGDTLYVSAIDKDGGGQVIAFDTAGGQVRWQTPLGLDFLGLLDTLSVSADTVLVPSSSRARGVIGLDAQTGAVRWRYVPPVPRFGSLTVTTLNGQGRAWIILQNGRVLALDAGTGQPIDRFNELEIDLQSITGFTQRPYVTPDGRRVVVALDTRLLGLVPQTQEGVP